MLSHFCIVEMATKKKDASNSTRQVLPSIEAYFYFIVHISVVVYIIYCVYVASNSKILFDLMGFNIYIFYNITVIVTASFTGVIPKRTSDLWRVIGNLY